MSHNEWIETAQTFLIRVLTVQLVFNIIDFIFRLFTERGLYDYEVRRTERKFVLLSSFDRRMTNWKNIAVDSIKLIGADILGLLAVNYCPSASMPYYLVLALKLYPKVITRRTQSGGTILMKLYSEEYVIESRIKILFNIIFTILLTIVYVTAFFVTYLIWVQSVNNYKHQEMQKNILCNLFFIFIDIGIAFAIGYFLFVHHTETERHLPPPPPPEWLDRANLGNID